VFETVLLYIFMSEIVFVLVKEILFSAAKDISFLIILGFRIHDLEVELV